MERRQTRSMTGALISGDSLPTRQAPLRWRSSRPNHQLRGRDVARPEEPIQPFRLLDLPAELRLQVFGYALSPSVIVDPVPENCRCCPPKKKKHTIDVALLHTNRQIYQEGVPLLYHVPIFEFSTPIKMYDWLTTRQYDNHFKPHPDWWMTIKNVKLILRFEPPNETQKAVVFSDWAAQLAVLNRRNPGLQTLTLQWRDPAGHGYAADPEMRRTMADLILASGIRDLRQLTMVNLEASVKNEMMEHLAPMLQGYQVVATAAD